MSLNMSSSPNTSTPSPPFALSASNFYDIVYACLKSTGGASILIVLSTTNFIFFPLYALVLHVGHQRWRQQRSFSHTDVFTYHMVAMELASIVGSICSLCGTKANLRALVQAGMHVVSINFQGQLLFHTLTCVERYLAVIHPIIYRRLRNQSGVKIRNISISCVWITCVAGSVILIGDIDYSVFIAVVMLGIALFINGFCSLSVLRALKRPGPGDGERVDQTKLKIASTILVIIGAVLLSLLHLPAQDNIFKRER